MEQNTSCSGINIKYIYVKKSEAKTPDNAARKKAGISPKNIYI